MVQSDALSRHADFIPEINNDNDDITMLLDHVFINLIDLSLQQELLSSKEWDMDATNALKILLDKLVMELVLNNQNWSTEDIDGKPVLFYNGWNYVLANTELCLHLLRQYHNHDTTGHPGELETYNSISRSYWWLSI